MLVENERPNCKNYGQLRHLNNNITYYKQYIYIYIYIYMYIYTAAGLKSQPMVQDEANFSPGVYVSFLSHFPFFMCDGISANSKNTVLFIMFTNI